MIITKKHLEFYGSIVEMKQLQILLIIIIIITLDLLILLNANLADSFNLKVKLTGKTAGSGIKNVEITLERVLENS